jgi:hypothetical protein
LPNPVYSERVFFVATAIIRWASKLLNAYENIVMNAEANANWNDSSNVDYY